MKRGSFKKIDNYSLQSLRQIVNTYAIASVISFVCYILFYMFDLWMIKNEIGNDVYKLVFGSVFLVSFCVIYVKRCGLLKSDECKAEGKNATLFTHTKKYIFDNWICELIYLLVVSLIFMLVYFISDMFSPFYVICRYLGETFGFLFGFLILVIMRMCAVLISFKRKPNVKSVFALDYKIGVALGALFVAIILFSPNAGSNELRNQSLLNVLGIALALVCLIRLIIRMIRLEKYKSKLKERKARDIKCNYFKIPNKCDMTFVLGGIKHNVVILTKIEKLARHYFEDYRTIRRFVGKVTSSRGMARAHISDQISWEELPEIVLPWGELKDVEKYILVWKRLPSEISDENSRNVHLGNNDLAMKKILLLDMDNFNNYISKISVDR